MFDFSRRNYLCHSSGVTLYLSVSDLLWQGWVQKWTLWNSSLPKRGLNFIWKANYRELSNEFFFCHSYEFLSIILYFMKCLASVFVCLKCLYLFWFKFFLKRLPFPASEIVDVLLQYFFKKLQCLNEREIEMLLSFLS